MPLTPEQFHTLYDLAAQPVALVQKDTITACNPPALHVLSPGSPFSALLPNGETLPRQLLQGATALCLQLRGARTQATVQPLEDAFLLFLPPITDKTAEHAALVHTAQALSAPLTTLLCGSGSVFSALSNTEDATLRKTLAAVNQSCYQLLRLKDNLATFCGTQRGELRLSRERFDLTDFFAALRQTAEDACRLTDHTLNTQLPQAPVYIWADRQQLRRALLALLSNALKFTPAGQTLHLSLARLGKRAVIRLSDSGEGMQPEVLSNAFQRYTRPPTLEDPRHGAGFGLPIAQAIIQAHGGMLLLQSLGASGTEALITLPIGQPGDTLLLSSPRVHIDRSGGFSADLVALSDALPASAFDVRGFV